MREKGREKRFQYVSFTVLLQRGSDWAGGGEERGKRNTLLMQKTFLSLCPCYIDQLQEGQDSSAAVC